MDVVDAGAADDGAAAGRCLDPRKSEEDRGRGGRRPHHARGRRRTDRGDVKVSEKLRILVTGFGPFPGAPYNPTQPLVARLTRLRRPAFSDVELSSHIFPVTYKAVDRELPELLTKVRPQALLMFGLASRTTHVRIETRARNAVTLLWPDAAQTRVRKGSIGLGPDALMFGPHTSRLLRAALGSGIDARPSRDAGAYLCNYLSWRAIEAGGPPHHLPPSAFVYVPLLARDGASRRKGFSRVTLEELVDAGGAMLLGMLELTRRAIREGSPTC